jgi:hypothetical protein
MDYKVMQISAHRHQPQQDLQGKLFLSAAEQTEKETQHDAFTHKYKVFGVGEETTEQVLREGAYYTCYVPKFTV